MAEQKVSIVVDVTDRLTEPVRKMNAAVRQLLDEVNDTAKAIVSPLGEAAANLGKVTGVTALARKFRDLGDSVKSVHGHVGGLVNGLAGMAGVQIVGLGAGMLAMGKSVMATSAETEKFETVLSSLLGSQEKAKEAMKGISDFADRTPFGLAEAVNGFVALKNNGLDPTEKTMGLLGDTAMALNRPLSEVVKATVDGTKGDMKGLQALGITSKTGNEEIVLSYTGKDGKPGEVKAPKDNPQALQGAILQAFQNKGVEGTLVNWSKTWEGMLASLNVAVSGFWQAIGDAGAFEFMKGKLQGLLDKIEEWKNNGTLQRWATAISDGFIAAFTVVENVLKRVNWDEVFTSLSDAIGTLTSWIQQAVSAVGGWENALMIVMAVLGAPMILAVVQLATAVGALIVGFAQIGASLLVMAAGPIGVAVMAIAGAAYAIYANWETVGPYVKDVLTFIENVFWAFVDVVMFILKFYFTPVKLVAQAVNAVVLYLTGIDLFAVGAEFIGGLWDGIKSKWGELQAWLAKAVSHLTEWMPDWVREKLGLKEADGTIAIPPVPEDAPGGAVPRSPRPVAGTAVATALVAGMTATPVPAETVPEAIQAPNRAPAQMVDQMMAPAKATARVTKTGAAVIRVGAVSVSETATPPAPRSPGSVVPPLPVPDPPVPIPRSASFVAGAGRAPDVDQVAKALDTRTASTAGLMETQAVRKVAEGAAPAAAEAANPAETAAKARPPVPPGWVTGDLAQTPPGQAFPPAGAVQAFPPTAPGAGSSIHAPVTVSITVNGVAELDQFRSYAEDAVRRALDDWTAQRQSDTDASLYDVR